MIFRQRIPCYLILKYYKKTPVESIRSPRTHFFLIKVVWYTLQYFDKHYPYRLCVFHQPANLLPNILFEVDFRDNSQEQLELV